MKHHSQLADFVNLDFEAIDNEILVDETKQKEWEGVADAAEGDGIAMGGVVDEGHVEVVVTAPWKKIFNSPFFFWKTLVASCFEALTQRQWMPPVLRL